MEQNKTMSEVMEDLAQKNFGGHDLVMYAYREAQEDHDIWMEMINTYKEAHEIFNEDDSFLDAAFTGIFHYFNLYWKGYDDDVLDAIGVLTEFMMRYWNTTSAEQIFRKLVLISDDVAAAYDLHLEYRP